MQSDYPLFYSSFNFQMNYSYTFFKLPDLLFIFFNGKVTNLLLPKSRRKELSPLLQVL